MYLMGRVSMIQKIDFDEADHAISFVKHNEEEHLHVKH